MSRPISELTEAALGGAGKLKPADDISEVEKVAKDISAVNRTKTEAEKLVGVSGYQAQAAQQQKEIKELQEKNEAQRGQLEQSKVDSIKSELGAQIAQIQQSVTDGASAKDVGSLIMDFKKGAEALGLTNNDKLSDIDKLFSIAGKMNQQKPFIDQLKEFESVAGMFNKGQPVVAQSDGMVQVELAKLQVDSQLTIQRMENERQERAQKFDMEKMQWSEDRDIKIAEINAKLTTEKERNQMIGGMVSELGRAFAQATMESQPQGGVSLSGRPAATPAARQVEIPTIEANVGEYGEIQCVNPNCKSTVPIAEDATKAICPGCKTVYPIMRKELEPIT